VYEDESIFSVTQRLVLLNCGPNNKRSAKALFSSSSLQFCSLFPSNVPQLQAMSNIDSSIWIENHSILPVFEAFTSEKKYQSAYRQMQLGDGDAVFKSLSLIANRQSTNNTMRYCSECAKEDKLSLGLSYWHTAHQLPGYYACHRHQIPLSKHRVSRKRFDYWPVNKTANTQPALQPLIALATFSRFFQYHYKSSDFEHALNSIYLSAMKDQGYLSVGGQIRVKVIHQTLKNYWLSLMTHPEVASIFDLKRRPLFPSGLFTKREPVIAPLKHLLLMAFLFKDVNELRCYDRAMNSINVNPREPLTISDESDEMTIVTLLNNKCSLRTVAATVERSISYVKQVACNHGISINSRAQRLFKTEKRQIISALKTGQTTEAIAKNFDCSQGAIEQILSQDKDLVKCRKALRETAKKQQMRCSMLSTIASLTHGTRNDIKQKNNPAYMWLFKHDKAWLYAHLPPAIPREHRRAKTESQTLSCGFLL
jgi:hypothetical protein